MICVPEKFEAQRHKTALEQGVGQEMLLEKAFEAFLQTIVRRNSKGFRIPSFVGSSGSGDPNWIDRHEELLWADDGNRR